MYFLNSEYITQPQVSDFDTGTILVLSGTWVLGFRNFLR